MAKCHPGDLWLTMRKTTSVSMSILKFSNWNAPLAFSRYLISILFQESPYTGMYSFLCSPVNVVAVLESLSFADQHGNDEMETMKVIFTRYAFDNDYQIWGESSF